MVESATKGAILVYAKEAINIHSTFSQPSLNIHSTFTQHSLNTLSTFTQHSLNIHLNVHSTGPKMVESATKGAILVFAKEAINDTLLSGGMSATSAGA
jgi:hypothetical protein